MSKFVMKLVLCIFVILWSFTSAAYAACTGASPTWTASDNTPTEIQACISAASSGDVIYVPAGTGSVNFGSSTVTINKSVKVVGPGRDALTVTWTGTVAFTSSSDTNDWRISGFTFSTATNQTAIDVVGGTGWRVDSCRYDNNISASSGVFVRTNILYTSSSIKGVIDSNIINHGKVLTNNGSVGLLIGGYLWRDPLGLGGEDAVYVEDNTFTFTTATSSGNCMDSNRGAKYVFRYNTVTQTGTMSHSLQAAAERGTRKQEIYGNRFNSLANTTFAGAYQRGGTGVIFYNDFTSEVPYNASVLLDNVRSVDPDTSDNTTGAGACDGDHIWDGNEDSSGYPCRDQIGRSSDSSLWTDGSSPSPTQELSPMYLWAEYAGGVAQKAYVATEGLNSSHIKHNRDYYDYNPAFLTTGTPVVGDNTTGGVGCGTLASRPSTCTTGVAYWATNQKCDDLTGMVGANPSTPISGTLYKCTATNTWEPYYTPYTYPHPLRVQKFTGNVMIGGAGLFN